MPLKSLLVTPAEHNITVGGTVQYTATGIQTNGTTIDLTAEAVWTSDDPSIVSIDAAGLATGVASGQALVQAAAQGFSAEAVLAVDVTLLSLAVSPSSAIVAMGQQQQFTVTGTYSDATTEDLTDIVSWGTSDQTVATIDAGGLATALAAGFTAAIARSANLAAGGTLQVTAATVISPCEALAQAKQRMILLAGGQATVVVDTPQLGRVEFNRGSIADLQRLIDGLAAECAASLGQTTSGRRKPISIEAWP